MNAQQANSLGLSLTYADWCCCRLGWFIWVSLQIVTLELTFIAIEITNNTMCPQWKPSD